jgi:hypothetical protein
MQCAQQRLNGPTRKTRQIIVENLDPLQTTICRENGQLFTPLGQWNDKIEYDWKYYLTSQDNYLYSRQDGTWRRHSPIRLGLVMKFNKEPSPSQPLINPYPVNPKLTSKTTLCATMHTAHEGHLHPEHHPQLAHSLSTSKYTWPHGNIIY